ncbi:MAG TPA: restriction endonuclease subunit S [Rectinemataceae bacterium]|nr:restriction endonuclease subunit S [Rectinemataceae bacterium]
MSSRLKWPRASIGDLVERVSNWSPSRDLPNGVFPYIDIGRIDSQNKTLTGSILIASTDAPSRARQLVKAGDILVSTVRPNLNAVAIVKEDQQYQTASTGFCVLRADIGYLYNRFLFHWLLTSGFIGEMVAQATGASYPAVTDGIIKAARIPLPPLSEQRRIAAILDSADAIRTKRKAAIAKLDELAQAVFLEMFGDPVRNEKGWEVISLRDEITFMTSGSRGWAKYHSNEGALFIKIQNVKNSRLVFDSVQHVVPPATQETNRTKVQEDDLLISITADLGRTAIVDRETAKRGAYINQHLVLVRLKKRSLLPMFASHYLESPAGKRQFSSLDQSAVKSGLNFDSINRLALISPPLELQASFIDRISSIVQLKNREALAFNKEESLFSSLQHRAFTGDL